MCGNTSERIRDSRAPSSDTPLRKPFRSADGEFDAAVSGLMLNFLPDPSRRPGRDGEGHTAWEYRCGLRVGLRRRDAIHAPLLGRGSVSSIRAAAELDEGRLFPICQPDALRRMFDAAGLSEIEVRAIDIPTVFADFDDYWTPFLGGQGPAPAYAASLSDTDESSFASASAPRSYTARWTRSCHRPRLGSRVGYRSTRSTHETMSASSRQPSAPDQRMTDSRTLSSMSGGCHEHVGTRRRPTSHTSAGGAGWLRGIRRLAGRATRYAVARRRLRHRRADRRRPALGGAGHRRGRRPPPPAYSPTPQRTHLRTRAPSFGSATPARCRWARPRLTRPFPGWCSTSSQTAAALSGFRRAVRSRRDRALYVWDYAGEMQPMRWFWDVAVELDPAAASRDEGIAVPASAGRTPSAS